MLLAVDIGNSEVTAGWFSGDRLDRVDRADTAADPAGILDAVPVAAVAAAGVVPAALEAWRAACAVRGTRHLELTAGDERWMTADYQPPESLGVDRLLAGLAAFERHGGPVLVADCGTATTLDAVDAGGRFRGGLILCGLGTARDALAERTARLPRVELAPVGRALAHSTAEALRGGLVLAHVEALAGLAARLRGELGAPAAPLIGTGGWSGLLAAAAPDLFATVEPDLVLWGLRLAARRLGLEG